jgi:hypothetical protein
LLYIILVETNLYKYYYLRWSRYTCQCPIKRHTSIKYLCLASNTWRIPLDGYSSYPTIYACTPLKIHTFLPNLALSLTWVLTWAWNANIVVDTFTLWYLKLTWPQTTELTNQSCWNKFLIWTFNSNITLKRMDWTS